MKSRLCDNCHQYHSRTYSTKNLKNTSVYKFNELFGKYQGHDSTLNLTQSQISFKSSKNKTKISRHLNQIINQSFYQTKKILQKTIQTSKKRMQTLYQESPFKKYLIYKQNSGKFVKQKCLTQCVDQKTQKPLSQQQNFRSIKRLEVDTPNKKILSKTSIMKIYDQERKKSQAKYTIAKHTQKTSSLKGQNKNFQLSQVHIHKFETYQPQQQNVHIYINDKLQEQQSLKLEQIRLEQTQKISKIKKKKLLKIHKPPYYSTFFDNRCCGVECESSKDLGQVVFDIQSFKKGHQDQFSQKSDFFQ